MLAHVGADPVPERFFTQEPFDHAEDRASLLVGDGVEVLSGLGGVADLPAHRVGRVHRIQVQRAGLPGVEVEPHPPLRAPIIDDLVGHPSGEGLVEPEVIPPLHGHPVAEPLVGKLVGDHLGDALLHAQRGVVGIEEQHHLPVGDQPRVLHGSGLEVRDADLVHLAEGVGQIEVRAQAGEDIARDLLSEAGEVRLVGKRPGAQRRALHVFGFGPDQGTGDDGDEVAAQDLGLGEGVGPDAALGLLMDQRSVGQGHHAFGHPAELQLPGGLEGGLVEAGEDAACVGGFELRAHHFARAVEAAQALTEGAFPGELQRPRAGAQRAIEAQGDGLARRHPAAARELEHIPRGVGPGGVAHLQIDAVKDELLLRRLQRDRQPSIAAEAVGGPVEVKVEGIRLGPDRSRQAEVRVVEVGAHRARSLRLGDGATRTCEGFSPGTERKNGPPLLMEEAARWGVGPKRHACRTGAASGSRAGVMWRQLIRRWAG